ncbi:MAG: NAD-dependent epimerase/dehydratase family protein [Selenomonadaceae bacterium]|nr:NAD-dependent epimerase/dehydratase family protein [Selenomonadaceae bacterium]
MKILVTGAGGFIGKNVVSTLKTIDEYEVLEYHFCMGLEKLENFCKECDFVFHFAGVNRPESTDEFFEGNAHFTEVLVNYLKAQKNNCPVLFTSSIQVELDNAYGQSKLAAENILRQHETTMCAKVLIYRLPNVFGKWCRPNYNSAVATFCHNIAHGLDIQINDPSREMHLVYIDDVIQEFMAACCGKEHKEGNVCFVPLTYRRNLQEIANLIKSFPQCRSNLSIPNQSDEFVKKLYSTYLSYLPEDSFSYELLMHKDNRGSFSEFIRTIGQGQFSVNIVKPHITKGNHWHHSKHEKFLVIVGKGAIRFRNIFSEKVIEYFVSDEKFEVIDIPPGYTHSIENTGETDMAVIIWANENFDPKNPDTYFMVVK